MGWDWGQIGFIYCTQQQAKPDGFDLGKEKDREKVRAVLRGEIETFSRYLQGDVAAFQLYKGGELIDSCGGLYGEESLRDSLTEHVPEDVADELVDSLE